MSKQQSEAALNINKPSVLSLLGLKAVIRQVQIADPIRPIITTQGSYGSRFDGGQQNRLLRGVNLIWVKLPVKLHYHIAFGHTPVLLTKGEFSSLTDR
jgi:hypothetical protein